MNVYQFAGVPVSDLKHVIETIDRHREFEKTKAAFKRQRYDEIKKYLKRRKHEAAK